MLSKDLTKLSMGENFFVEIVGCPKKRYRAALVGFYQEEYLIITPGSEELRELLLVKGTELKIRALTGSAALAFISKVTSFAPAPEPHCFITYPKDIVFKEVRKAPRVDTKEVACQLTVCGQEQQPAELVLINLSTTGCQLEASESLGGVGEHIQLALALTLGEQAYQLELPCIIRNDVTEEKVAGKIHQIGIEFKIMESKDAVALHSLVYQILFQSSQL